MIFYRMKIKMFLYIETGISSFFLHENKFQQVFLVFQGKLNPRGQKNIECFGAFLLIYIDFTNKIFLAVLQFILSVIFLGI